MTEPEVRAQLALGHSVSVDAGVGYRVIAGPLVGAVTIYMVDQLVFKNLIPSGHQVILGALLVAMIIVSPDGLLSLLGRVR